MSELDLVGGSERCPPPWRFGAPPVYDELAGLLAGFRFRPGWTFELITYGAETMLAISCETIETHAVRPGLVGHKIPVPPRQESRAWWRRWLLDRIIDVETHEACEWFREVVEGVEVRPFDPHHDPMQPAYAVRDWVGDG